MTERKIHRRVACLNCGMRVGIHSIGDLCDNCGEVSSQAPSVRRFASRFIKGLVRLTVVVILIVFLGISSLAMLVRWAFSTDGERPTNGQTVVEEPMSPGSPPKPD